MKNNVVEEVRKFVEEECNKHPLGREIFINHFISVVKYSKKLAEELSVDEKLIEIAAWLHDIGSIIYGRENHHITGAEIAEKELKKLNYPEEKIQLVKKCILNHRGSIGNKFGSIEEKIVAEADCLAFFDNLEGYILWVIDSDKIKNQKKIKDSVKQKAINKWNQLSKEAQELIKPKFNEVMLLFGE